MALFKRKNNESTASSGDQASPGLTKMKTTFGDRIKNLFQERSQISGTFLDEFEEILIAADVGVDTTLEIIENLKIQARRTNPSSYDELRGLLTTILMDMIPAVPYTLEDGKINVLFVIGVNGTGKTTSIAKLAHLYQSQGKKVLLGACDTFRAAAIEQLATWADRVNVPLVKQEEGSNPGSTLYNSIDKAVSLQSDLLIVDTAGRLHNRANLMAEIEKLNRILEKKALEHPLSKKNMIVLDAGTGQNAFSQAESFNKSIGVDGVIMSKMDSTAKGGIVIALGYKLKLPVQFIGIGEKIDQLQPFSPTAFLESMLP
jgi:fused signal recognition particle receptor